MAETYTILICDDEPGTRFGLRDNAPWASWNIRPVGVAGDGQEALDFVFQNPPEIILTDVRMPFMDGLEFVETLKTTGYTGKIVFMSAHGEVAYLKKALNLDAVDYILKPISMPELSDVMMRVVAKLNTEQVLAEQIRRGLPLLRDRFVSALVYGTSFDSGDASAEADSLGLPYIPGESFRFWVVEARPEAAKKVLTVGRELFTHEEALVSQVADNRVVGLIPSRLLDPERWVIALAGLSAELDRAGLDGHRMVDFSEVPDLESIAEIYAQASQSPVAPPSIEHHGLAVERVKALVMENAKSGLSVRWLAKEVGLSHTYLCMLFKKQTGLTLGEYQTRIKIDLAKKFLADPRKKSYEVGYDVGYNNPGYFARTFKRVTGMSPIEYRDSVIAHQS